MKKQLKVIICLFLCAGVLLSLCPYGHNSEHNCIGEDCRVCHDIALQREFSRALLMCLFCGGAAFTALQLTVLMLLSADKLKKSLNLVDNKVKLTA